ncbi:type VI secretion system tube protein Hcp [Botrimarina sp.]|uniref:Hcp family type VI secretion system effector n=1 Tax=Botrimarina sp. TaxID=2795802 RepID=UPI0032EDA67D
MGAKGQGGSIDYFLKIDGIDGESKDSKHGKEIQILGFSWGETQPVSIPFTSGGGSGKVNMQDLTFTMYACKASPKLFLSCAKGEHIKEATLVARKAGGEQEDFYSIKLEEVLVSSYHTSGGSGTTLPMDTVTLAFAKISYEYRPQKDKGALDTPVKAGWNLEENKTI